MKITLYQFPISHYCEKVRWALDYKNIPYTTKNLLPGAHIKLIRNMAPHSSVPVLEADGTTIQGSARIIDWLDETFPERPLTPADSRLAEEARLWERFADQEIGPHIRRWAYYSLLQAPKEVIPVLTAGAPFWQKAMFWLFFPKIRAVMRQTMQITQSEAEMSAELVDEALDRLRRQLNGDRFLVGDSFSRADLAASALLAPMFTPPQYGVPWPKNMPEPLQSWTRERQPKLAWARQIYEGWR